MAGTAGSVAPVFHAEGYVATNIYDFYHAIIHNNKLYFCRQDGTIGHEPTGVTDEYWFLSLDGNFGDATKLGGESAAQWQTKIDVEKARIDALITLEESGELTDIEKEVNDIKVGADGVTYGSAGTAVREQISSVKSDLSKEITNRNTAISNEETARNMAISEAVNTEKNRAVARENEIEELFSLPTEEAVSKWLGEHPEATTTVQDASLETVKFTEDAKLYVMKDYITPQMFGAKGDGVTDDSDAIISAIKACYTKTGGWTPCKKLFFPKGTYLVSKPLIDLTTGVPAGQFYFEGESKFGAKIKTTADVLFDNQGIFGFTCFENLSFVGNDTKFMNFVGGGTGNAQSISFENCAFSNFHTIIETSGSTMSSEVTFDRSKISGCGSTDNPCELFIFNNEQGVNWRFYATDIEVYTGTCFRYLKGTTVYMYQGSNIPINGKFIDCSDAVDTSFAANNSPNISCYGIRFELRNSKLFYRHGGLCLFRGIFDCCGMGGFNIENDDYAIDFTENKVQLHFIHCFNLQKYKIYVTDNTNDDTGVCTTFFRFERCDINPEYVIKNSSITLTGSQTLHAPMMYVDGRRFPLVTSLYINAIQSADMAFKDIALVYPTDKQGVVLSSNYVAREYTLKIYGYIKTLSIINLGVSGFGDTTATFTVYNEDGEVIGEPLSLGMKGGTCEFELNKYYNTITLKTMCNYPASGTYVAPLIITGNIFC